ncbi:unnamed protein product [Kuraishia capsulata CBS 1993]|uniref:Protein kinase domain-containing protein n=1 Tax=Kuraishia capsulata CBS 1993 TaxID=1382522 RepID=W6MIQ4_9ASCO|nr:uncharacterized protein KUCA_T00001992001 [Kuraishia capsulata CBS 1993]CDK26021.1 unnamed protein product [Kuraishia capsulata CBS 1993]
MSAKMEYVEETVQDGHSGEYTKIAYAQRAMVGHGSFGYVYQISIQPDDRKAAIKRVLQDKRFKNRELDIMRTISHKNIVNLISFFYKTAENDDLYLHLILEFIPETLFKASHYYTSRRLTMPAFEVKLYSYQLLRSLNYIHSLGICHRDIKPQNLLIDPYNGILKLCDFGSAKILNPQEPNVSYICSRYYRAPELIFGSRNYTTKIDVWSAGCVIAELILGQPLFPGESGIDQLVEIIKILGTPSRDEIRTMNPNYMEHKFPSIKPIPLNKVFKATEVDCLQLLQHVLSYSPLARVSAIESLTLPYFDELRAPNVPLPDSRMANKGIPKLIPDVLDFSKRELSVRPDLVSVLIPEWKRTSFADDYGFSLDFVPFSEEELKNPELN